MNKKHNLDFSRVTAHCWHDLGLGNSPIRMPDEPCPHCGHPLYVSLEGILLVSCRDSSCEYRGYHHGHTGKTLEEALQNTRSKGLGIVICDDSILGEEIKFEETDHEDPEKKIRKDCW